MINPLSQIHLKVFFKRLIQKTEKGTCALIGNKDANKITKVSKSLQQNNSEAVTNENDKETPKEKYVSPEVRQEIIYEFRLK